jgi:hypothetical protein
MDRVKLWVWRWPIEVAPQRLRLDPSRLPAARSKSINAWELTAP